MSDPTTAEAAVRSWREKGTLFDHGDIELFVIDAPSSDAEQHEPLIVLHGFPSSSFDYRRVLDRLAEHRRVLLLDFPGFGFSAKPDIRYGIRMHADAVEAAAAHWDIREASLLTHDMGNSVGGELLRRSLEGTLPFEVTTRVITNGSIYIEIAHLTDGQQLLLSLPDAALGEPGAQPPPGLADSFGAGLALTFAPGHQPSTEELDAQWRLCAHHEGFRLLARTIRYIEDRRQDEQRFTGAIETHPSPLSIVWGALDPVAVLPMAERLHAARPDGTLTILDGIGHYPMIEDPDRFASEVLKGLDAA